MGENHPVGMEGNCWVQQANVSKEMKIGGRCQTLPYATHPPFCTENDCFFSIVQGKRAALKG